MWSRDRGYGSSAVQCRGEVACFLSCAAGLGWVGLGVWVGYESRVLVALHCLLYFSASDVVWLIV